MLLQKLTIMPYQRIILLTALKFVTAFQALDSLEIMTLALDIHQPQGEGIADQASSTTSQLKLHGNKSTQGTCNSFPPTRKFSADN